MEDLMQQIEAVFYLIENQGLTTAEKLERVEKLVSKEMKAQNRRHYAKGFRTSVHAIKEEMNKKGFTY